MASMLYAEVQLTCGGLERFFRFEVHRSLASLPSGQRRRTEYTRKTIVETMPYIEVDVSEQQGAPVRTGVQHFEVSADEAGQRLDNYVHKRLGEIPRSKVYRVIRKGEVRVNGHRAGPDTRLQAHDKIRIPPVRIRPPEEIGRPSTELQEAIRKASSRIGSTGIRAAASSWRGAPPPCVSSTPC
jgi:hypothetical protein